MSILKQLGSEEAIVQPIVGHLDANTIDLKHSLDAMYDSLKGRILEVGDLVKEHDEGVQVNDADVNALLKKIANLEEEVTPDPDPEPPVIIVPGQGWKQGQKNVFTDAHDLDIIDYKYNGGGNALTFRGECKNISIVRPNFQNCSKGVFVDRFKNGTIQGLTMLDGFARNLSKSYLDASKGTNSILIKGLDYDGKYNDSENFAMGIILRGCSGVAISDFNIRNILYYKWDREKGKYLNADGISIEGGDNIVISNGFISNCSDGGIDSKVGITIDNVEFNGCKRSIRVWDKKNITILKDVTIKNCNGIYVYHWLSTAAPDTKLTKVVGTASLWKRWPECEVLGWDKVKFENSRTSIVTEKK